MEFDELQKDIEEQAAGTEKVQSVAILKQQIIKEESETRKRLATRFITWYFGILIVILIGTPVYNAIVHQLTHDNYRLLLDVKELLQIYSSIVGPLAGFVIAYYFKNR